MTDDIHALSGAYAVDAVDDLERAAFERHLAQCSTCSEEVASLREAAAVMSALTSTPAPASLREQVLGAVAVTRPLSPLPLAVRPRATRRRLAGLVAAAAAFVVIGGAGATVWHPWSDTSSVMQSEAEQVRSASDHQVVPDAAGTGSTIVRSASLNKAYVTTDLPAPAPGTVYELWLFNDGSYARAGLLSQGGKHTVMLTGDPATATWAGITVEKAGGTDKPDLSSVVSRFDLKSA